MTTSTSKTKKNIIEVARQLFAKKGFENTTINEIADVSEYGRRTIYTYFKNKNDIYKEVISCELETMHNALEDVTKRDLPADEKLMLFTFARLSVIKEVVTRNGTLRADFFRNIWTVQPESILTDGCESDVFHISSISKTAEILHYALKGLEVPVIRGV